MNYEEISRKSLRAKVNSTKNINVNKVESASGHLSVEELKNQ